MVIQFLNMSSSGTTALTNCSNGIIIGNNQHSSLSSIDGNHGGGETSVLSTVSDGGGGNYGVKPSLSLSLSNNSSSSSSASSSITGGGIGNGGSGSGCFNGGGGGQILTLSKFQQDAATSPTIPLLSTLLYDCNDSEMYYSTNNNSGDDLTINNNSSCITPTSTLTSIGCSSPLLNRISPQFNINNTKGLDSKSTNDVNSVVKDFKNNIITNKNCNNQLLTNNGSDSRICNGPVKTLLIKSTNCRPSDLVCDLKSPNTCLACYTNCSTCSYNVNNNSIKSTFPAACDYSRLFNNSHHSSIKRVNDTDGRNCLNGINGTPYFQRSVNGLTYVNSYGSINKDGPTTTTITTAAGDISTMINNNSISSTLSHSYKPATTTISGNGGSVIMVPASGGRPSTGPNCVGTTRGGGLTIPTINISPVDFDYHLPSSSPTNSRTYDKFDNFNSNIFNDHCSAISAPLSSYYLNEPKDHSCFRKSIPTMPIALSAFLLLLNCFLPGSGTILSSITILFGCPTEYGKGKWKRAFLLTLIAGILQFVTAIFVFGWVWSIMTGINFIKHSNKMKESKFGYGDAL